MATPSSRRDALSDSLEVLAQIDAHRHQRVSMADTMSREHPVTRSWARELRDASPRLGSAEGTSPSRSRSPARRNQPSKDDFFSERRRRTHRSASPYKPGGTPRSARSSASQSPRDTPRSKSPYRYSKRQLANSFFVPFSPTRPAQKQKQTDHRKSYMFDPSPSTRRGGSPHRSSPGRSLAQLSSSSSILRSARKSTAVPDRRARRQSCKSPIPFRAAGPGGGGFGEAPQVPRRKTPTRSLSPVRSKTRMVVRPNQDPHTHDNSLDDTNWLDHEEHKLSEVLKHCNREAEREWARMQRSHPQLKQIPMPSLGASVHSRMWNEVKWLLKKKVDEQDAKNRRLASRLQRLEAEAEQADSRRADLERSMASMADAHEKEVQELEGKVTTLRREKDVLLDELDRCCAQLESMRAQLDEVKKAEETSTFALKTAVTSSESSTAELKKELRLAGEALADAQVALQKEQARVKDAENEGENILARAKLQWDRERTEIALKLETLERQLHEKQSGGTHDHERERRQIEAAIKKDFSDQSEPAIARLRSEAMEAREAAEAEKRRSSQELAAMQRKLNEKLESWSLEGSRAIEEARKMAAMAEERARESVRGAERDAKEVLEKFKRDAEQEKDRVKLATEEDARQRWQQERSELLRKVATEKMTMETQFGKEIEQLKSELKDRGEQENRAVEKMRIEMHQRIQEAELLAKQRIEEEKRAAEERERWLEEMKTLELDRQKLELTREHTRKSSELDSCKSEIADVQRELAASKEEVRLKHAEVCSKQAELRSKETELRSVEADLKRELAKLQEDSQCAVEAAKVDAQRESAEAQTQTQREVAAAKLELEQLKKDLAESDAGMRQAERENDRLLAQNEMTIRDMTIQHDEMRIAKERSEQQLATAQVKVDTLKKLVSALQVELTEEKQEHLNSDQRVLDLNRRIQELTDGVNERERNLSEKDRLLREKERQILHKEVQSERQRLDREREIELTAEKESREKRALELERQELEATRVEIERLEKARERDRSKEKCHEKGAEVESQRDVEYQVTELRAELEKLRSEREKEAAERETHARKSFKPKISSPKSSFITSETSPDKMQNKMAQIRAAVRGDLSASANFLNTCAQSSSVLHEKLVNISSNSSLMMSSESVVDDMDQTFDRIQRKMREISQIVTENTENLGDAAGVHLLPMNDEQLSPGAGTRTISSTVQVQSADTALDHLMDTLDSLPNPLTSGIAESPGGWAVWKGSPKTKVSIPFQHKEAFRKRSGSAAEVVERSPFRPKPPASDARLDKLLGQIDSLQNDWKGASLARPPLSAAVGETSFGPNCIYE